MTMATSKTEARKARQEEKGVKKAKEMMKAKNPPTTQTKIMHSITTNRKKTATTNNEKNTTNENAKK